MQPLVQELARQGVKVQAVDVDQQLHVAQQFKVPGVPTFVALVGGQEAGRIVGATSYEKLAELVKGAGSGSRLQEADRKQQAEDREQLSGGQNGARGPRTPPATPHRRPPKLRVRRRPGDHGADQS